MESHQLTAYVFGQGSLFSPDLSRWIRSCERFKSFVEDHKEKVRKKIAGAQKGEGDREESLKDVVYELRVAYLLLQSAQFAKVEYEKYGTGKQRSPDFTVTSETGLVFNVEVKRIREALPEVRLTTWARRIQSQISTIPSDLAVSVRILPDRFDDPTGWLTRLEKETQRIVEYVKAANRIHVEKADISLGEAGPPHPVPGFADEIEIIFRRPPRKSTCTLDWYGGEFPVFSTQREYRKFGDTLVYSLGQMVRDMVNVLVISTSSNTHGYFDFREALQSLAEMIASDDERFFTQKGFLGRDDFLSQLGKLSGVLFRSAWRVSNNILDHFDTLWCNTEADESSLLPLEIARALRTID